MAQYHRDRVVPLDGPRIRIVLEHDVVQRFNLEAMGLQRDDQAGGIGHADDLRCVHIRAHEQSRTWLPQPP
eukprot:CAMPEP_0115629936 /NCGR_PEP_ID=MMETSP0272-20121206/30209_1 /TAXON_ID=71861 /ORGANISM="Scrippsiella trochoidea, Strain CCMP3099" /LENGTH=70 /DNA_ID=CAMNT_0003066523 /DNA_START=324 /DNA_END=536 /DNA_ORIENTATION=-